MTSENNHKLLYSVNLLTYYSAPGRAPACCDERVCLSVCLSDCPHSTSVSPELHVQILPFLCMWPMVVARASSSGVAICYVVPVIWMAPCLHIKDKNNRREKNVCSKWHNRGQHGFDTAAYSQTDPPGDSSGVWYLRLPCWTCECLVNATGRPMRMVSVTITTLLYRPIASNGQQPPVKIPLSLNFALSRQNYVALFTAYFRYLLEWTLNFVIVTIYAYNIV